MSARMPPIHRRKNNIVCRYAHAFDAAPESNPPQPVEHDQRGQKRQQHEYWRDAKRLRNLVRLSEEERRPYLPFLTSLTRLNS
jgi:hypothetical protein